MTQDLSANTLETVRKNMTVMSFMIIVFFFAGGHIPDTGVILKLPLSNIEFAKPERLLYVLWVMMAWWIYRYFTLGAWSEFVKWFDVDIQFKFKKGLVTRFLLTAVTGAPSNNEKAIQGATHISLHNQFSKSHMRVVYFNGSSNIGSGDIKGMFPKFIIYLFTGVLGSQLITFALPLIMTTFAFYLTINNQLL